MCNMGVCLLRIRSSKHKKSPVVCLSCYSNYDELSINNKAPGLSASVQMLMSDDIELSPGSSKRC